jgi:hypothetical protein
MHNALMSATLVGSKNNTDISETNPSDSNPSDSDKDKLLDKLFPNLSFKNGKVETDIPGLPVTLSLKNS